MDDRRRTMLTGTAALAVAVVTGSAAGEAWARKPRPSVAAPAEDPTATLRAAFARLSTTLNGGDVAGFLGLFDERALVIDEDAPFRFSKAEFIEHLGFHGNKNWEGFAWVPRETRYVVRGNTGLTAGGVTFRGKPVDAGFRLRHMLHTIGWHRTGADWRIVCFHQTPLWGHLDGASPGTGG